MEVESILIIGSDSHQISYNVVLIFPLKITSQ